MQVWWPKWRCREQLWSDVTTCITFASTTALRRGTRTCLSIFHLASGNCPFKWYIVYSEDTIIVELVVCSMRNLGLYFWGRDRFWFNLLQVMSFSRWSSKLKMLWRHCLWQTLMQLHISNVVLVWNYAVPITEHPFFLLQRCHSWRHCDCWRVPTTQQNCEVQRPQSDKSCWSQEAVPEVLDVFDQESSIG